MRIQWERTVYVGKAPSRCLLCGGQFRPPRVQGQVYLLAVIYDPQDKYYGEACPACVASGPQRIQTMLHERISSLRQNLHELETLALQEILMPSLEEEFQNYFK